MEPEDGDGSVDADTAGGSAPKAIPIQNRFAPFDAPPELMDSEDEESPREPGTDESEEEASMKELPETAHQNGWHIRRVDANSGHSRSS